MKLIPITDWFVEFVTTMLITPIEESDQIVTLNGETEIISPDAIKFATDEFKRLLTVVEDNDLTSSLLALLDTARYSTLNPKNFEEE